MRDFTELQVWQEAHNLTLLIYHATRSYPKEELFGLTRQTRDAVASIEANIAEGHGRFGDREFRHFCNIAHGSLAETRCHLLIARDLTYLAQDQWATLERQALRVVQLLQGLLPHLGAEK